jgi:hypothetical protein
MRSVPFTLVVDKRRGRRFSGTFSSARSSEKVGSPVVAAQRHDHDGDDDGYHAGHGDRAQRIRALYLRASAGGAVASCTELTKQ